MVYKAESGIQDKLKDLEPPYESEQEAQIGRLLDQYGIPFFYKQATIVYNQGRNELWKPAFTLVGYGGLVIDYVPEATRDRQLHREQLYRYNQIPAVVVGPPDLAEPNWDEKLYQRLLQMSREPLDLTRYVPAPGPTGIR